MTNVETDFRVTFGSFTNASLFMNTSAKFANDFEEFKVDC